MRVQYFLCACLLLCGCTKVSDLTHQKSKSIEKAPVTVKKANKIKIIDCKNDSSQQVTFEAKGDSKDDTEVCDELFRFRYNRRYEF